MKFSERDPEFLKKRAEAYKQKKDNPNAGNRDFIFKEQLPMFSPKDGENIIRLLPATWEKAYFPWVEAYIHYQVGAKGGQFLCLTKMQNQACPICEEAKKQTDQKLARVLYPQHRAIAWLIDRSTSDKGPLVWIMPYKAIAHQVLTISFKRSTGEPVFVDDPREGWDIIFTKSGKMINTSYSGIRKDDEPTVLHSDDGTAGKWLQFIEEKSLPALLNFQTYDYIKDALFGAPVEEEAEEQPITSATTRVKETQPEASTEVHIVESSELNGKVPVGDGLSLAKINAMVRDELVALIDTRNLDVNPEDWSETEDLASAVSLELGITS